uniref:SWI/SNF-related matrix-associated actin-dependent regulator of chromatin subfamily A-like protein 1 n=1 Tax=Neogobius melanostomus TaxID=47308 RepID=A0A8C6WXU2_9GOBI
MSNQLTPEQQQRMEENRRRALERRAQRLGQAASLNRPAFSGSSVQSVQSHKPFAAPVREEPPVPLSESNRFVPPFKKNQSSHTKAPGPALISANKGQHVNSPVLSGGSLAVKPTHAQSNNAPSSNSGGAVGSFYKQPSKSAPNPEARPAPSSFAKNPAPAKRPAISLRGKCVPHTEGRFRVEVGFHAQLIDVFKSIPSRNFGKLFQIFLWYLSLSALVQDAAAIASVSLGLLEGMEAPDIEAATSRARDGAPLGALLRLCSGWQKPGAILQGQCVLVSPSKFEVDIGYHVDVIAAFKQMPTKSYDMTTRKWSFSLEDYKPLSKFYGIAAVEVEPLPRAIIQAFCARFQGPQARSVDIPEADLSNIDPTLTTSLMPFQRVGVNFAVSKEGRLLLADDMGLGKTIQAMCIAAYYKSEWPVLVVAPSSVRFTWAEAFRRWLPSLEPDSINVVVKAKDNLRSGLVNIISYDLLSRIDKQHPGNSFKVLIMDESHFMKNMKTARCKAALPLLKAAKRVVLLSGTPAMSRPAELYTQILAVRPTLYPRFHDFGVRYCDAKQMNWGWDYSGSSNLAELKLLLEECLMLRRLKSEVLSQLPAKQRKVVTITIDGISNRTKAALSAAAKELAKGHRNKTEEKEALLVFYNYTAEAKLQAIMEYITDMLECGREKFLVFAHHKLILDHITAELSKKDVSFIRIDGATPSAERQLRCEKFQHSTKPYVAVLSITAANMGLTLHAADLVIFAELFWNPGVLIQAEDRVHRIGQTSNVNIHYLVAKGTADDHLWYVSINGRNLILRSQKCVLILFVQDPNQRSIMEMFQRSFTAEDDIDESLLVEAANEWDDGTTPTVNNSNNKSTNKRSIGDYFSR